MPERADVTIVGGGVIGCAAAYEVSKAGVKVVLVERGQIGGEASSASAGLLVPLHVLEEGGPQPYFEYCWRGFQLFASTVPELEEETGITIEYEPSGVLYLAQSEDEEELLRERFTWWHDELKMPVSWVDEKEAHEMEPELSPTVRGGIFSKEEASINGERLTEALARGAVQRGAEILEGCTATGVKCTGNRIKALVTNQGDIATAHLVIAAGAWSRFCTEWFNFPIPVTPARGQMFAARHVERLLRRPIISHNGGLFPKRDGTVHVGATVELVGFNKANTPEGIATLLEIIPPLLPKLSQCSIVKLWAGLRPWCEDGYPVIGALPGWEGVFLTTGHYRSGIVASLITGRVVKELLVDGRWDESLEPFSPKRFDN